LGGGFKVPADLLVLGLGYVGLPLAREAAFSGLKVVGYDLDGEVVALLNSGRSHVGDVPAADLVEMLANGFRATVAESDVGTPDTVVICVPTPLGPASAPDLTAVRAATEMAGRLLGYPRVGLATLVEELLGLRLEKTHSAADWSTRPLPEEWLRYAALDVEVLVELRDVLARQLTEQGKLEWARQEFAAVLAAGPPEPRADPWRRTSGIHRVRNRRGLAIVRELWLERDKIARQRDLSPTKVLPDRAIIEAARSIPAGTQELAKKIPGARFELIEAAGHFMPTTAPAKLLALLRDFFKGVN